MAVSLAMEPVIRISRPHRTPKHEALRIRALGLVATLALLATSAFATDLAQTIERVKPSVVAIGTFVKIRSPSIQFVGTGFVVADGRHVITNAHIVDKPLDTEKKEIRIVLVSRGGEPQPREAEVLAMDRLHDIALLKISGDAIPALKLGDSDSVREGRLLAFTGFPIGMVLGFHPATHRGMVSAITPVVLPAITARQLTATMISRAFGLRGVQYRHRLSGQSGRTHDPDDGTVRRHQQLCAVYRENAISHPSGMPTRFRADTFMNLLTGKVPGFE